MIEEREVSTAQLPKFETLMADIPGSNGPLSATQRKIFWMLHNADGRIVRHREIWNTLYSLRPECDWPTSDVIKTHICHIRKKLRGWDIICHHGIGYKMKKREG